jgi:hypothetical protein
LEVQPAKEAKMRNRNLRWALWMTLIGVGVAVAVYVATSSAAMALLGLVASGMIVNAVIHPATRQR